MPKLRVAASLGVLSATATAMARRRAVIRPPSTLMVNRALRAANVARAHLAHRAFGASLHLDVARAHDVDLGGARRMGPDIARAGDADIQILNNDALGIDVACPGDVIVGASSLAGAGNAAGAGDAHLELADIERLDAEIAGTGDVTVEAVALHLVDADSAGAGE